EEGCSLLLKVTYCQFPCNVSFCPGVLQHMDNMKFRTMAPCLLNCSHDHVVSERGSVHCRKYLFHQPDQPPAVKKLLQARSYVGNSPVYVCLGTWDHISAPQLPCHGNHFEAM